MKYHDEKRGKTQVKYVEQAEEYWRTYVLARPSGTDFGDVVVQCDPTATIPSMNHATHIAVDESDAEDLLRRVNDHFTSNGASFTAFRLSPLTRPRSFAALLERHGLTFFLLVYSRWYSRLQVLQ